MLGMGDELEYLQYPPKERKIWFCVQTSWHKTQQFLQTERVDPAPKNHHNLKPWKLEHKKVNQVINTIYNFK